MTRYAAELAFALEVAGRAGELQMDRYERVERIDYKSARDVVTEVDHLSEALILDAIRAAFPGDALLAEETGEHDGGAHGQTATSGVGRVWVVDPLDGTINYANGIPFFCVSIALVEAGRPVVGVVHDPTRRESFAATADGPATLCGQRDPRLRQGEAERLRHLDGAVRPGGRDPGPRGPEGDPRPAFDGVGRARAGVRRQRPISTPSSSRAGSRPGTSPPRASSPSGPGRPVTNLAGGPWFEIARSSRSIGVLAAPPAHHGELLRLLS